MMRIVVVEDDPALTEALAKGLGAEGYEVAVAPSGEEGFFLGCERPFDLMVLDLTLPRRGGLEVLSALRARGVTAPVLIMTARDDVLDRVAGLDGGADDYVCKPFAFPELLARIRALLRRGGHEQPARLSCADLALDPATRHVTRAGVQLELTVREFELLAYLLANAGRVVSREMLQKDVWLERERTATFDNVVDVHVARLRAKVDRPFARKLLHTVRGVGFVLREES
jgi:DNA-binding response OmpR family regulator